MGTGHNGQNFAAHMQRMQLGRNAMYRRIFDKMTVHKDKDKEEHDENYIGKEEGEQTTDDD